MNHSKEMIFYSKSFPIDEVSWYVPIKYYVRNELIDLITTTHNREELFIRFKIIESTTFNYIDGNNLSCKYKVLTYDEDKTEFEERISEIEFRFSNGKGKIFIRHPDFSEMVIDASTH